MLLSSLNDAAPYQRHVDQRRLFLERRLYELPLAHLLVLLHGTSNEPIQPATIIVQLPRQSNA